MKHLITIVGPTAIGKTSLSIALAKHFDCDIISCDSRQFFKEMRIGTAVPSAQELAAANHHFIHNKSVLDHYNVGDFEKDAIYTLEELHKTNDFAIMVGGSGLYVDAVLQGLDNFPAIDKSIREQINQNYDEQGISYLQTELKRLDPEYYNIVDKENPQRMIRALEVSIGTNQAYSTFLNKNKSQRKFQPILIGLEAERNIVYDRINQRVDLMIADGLIDEAKQLLPHKKLNALQTVGYRELFNYLDGNYTINEAVEDIKKNTRRFAKRQLTWFKRNKNTTWFKYDQNQQDIIDFIEKYVVNN